MVLKSFTAFSFLHIIGGYVQIKYFCLLKACFYKYLTFLITALCPSILESRALGANLDLVLILGF